MKSNKPPPPPRVIAIDVDGTLHTRGVPNHKLIDWIRTQKTNGFYLMLWSSAGERHARVTAELFGITNLFDCIISKPGYIVDDQGWSWIKYTQVITGID